MCLIWVQDDFEKDSRTGSVPNSVEREVEKEPGVGELGEGGRERLSSRSFKTSSQPGI